MLVAAGVASLVALALLALPTGASAFDAKLKRYPYLTDLVGSSVIVNWATDMSAQSAVVKWGEAGSGSCTANTATATRTFIFVNGVSEYQWKAQITGLAPDAEYCYRVFLGTSPEVDLLDADPSPSFRTQVPAGSPQPFKFAVLGDWAQVDDPSGQNPHQANVIAQVAASGARFAVTTGDNAALVGSQKNYGDLYQAGANTSAVFGPSFWKAAGASLPLFPALGNHDHNSSTLLVNWPQDTAVSTSGGRYTTDTYCCLNGTSSRDYPSAWYAFDAGLARFYVLDAAWQNSNVGSANLFKNDYDNHWAPGTPQYEWLANDLATHPRALRFAFFHFPLYSDQSSTSSDTYLQGAGSLEGLLNQYDVTAAFTGHSHNYQRNDAPPGGVPTHVSGGGGANPEGIGAGGCSAPDAYGIGWSNQSDVGSACGGAPVPESRDRFHHFLLVSVNGTSVTVTPTDELGRTFDTVTYNAAGLEADLELTAAASPDPALVGEPVTYTLVVRNTGPQAATGVRLTDDLPAGVAFESATPTQGTCAEVGGTVTCSLGALAGGDTASVEIEVTPQAVGTLTNQARVASDVNDPDPDDNAATTETAVDPVADLSVTKSGAPDPVLAGELLTYTVAVHNSGPSSASGVSLFDTLPAGVTFESAVPSRGNCSDSGGTVGCALGTLADGEGASVLITVRAREPGTVTNQANVLSFVADSDSEDNSARAETTVLAAADLSLTKSAAPDPVPAGAQVTYTLAVQNAGPQAATGVTVTDDLPAGVTFDSATPTQGSCAEAGGEVACALGTVASGDAASVELKVTAVDPGAITNEAGVTSDIADPRPADNRASAATTVDPVADLSVTSSDAPDPVPPGELLTYTLEVRNGGTHAATAVQLVDDLPAEVAFESATPSQGDCSESVGTVECALGTLGAEQGATVEIKVRPEAVGQITNQAGVASGAHDPRPGNNTASADTMVEVDSTPPAAPTLTGTDPGSPANDNTPEVKGSAEPGSTVRLYSDPDCSGPATATGPAADLSAPGLTVAVTDDSTTTVRATATDAAGNTSGCSTSSATYVEDSTAPDEPVLTDTDPDSPANENNPAVKGSAESGSTVKLYTGADCSGAVAATGSAATFFFPGLSVSVADDSTTTFRATATDAAGNTSACSLSPITYTEDSSTPITQCSDAIDNDSDGKIDFGTQSTNDPGCTSAADDSESEPRTLTFDAEADARVEQASASTNFGTLTTLRTDSGAGANVETFLRFNVTGVAGQVTSAKLRLFASSGTVDGPAVFTTGSAWIESGPGGLTWSNRPPRTSAATDDKGSIAGSSFVEFDVKPLVAGDGLHGFTLATTSTDGADFSSREVADATRRPVLIVTSGTDTENPAPPADLSAQAASATRVDLAWTAATDDFGVAGYKVYRDGSELATIGPTTSYSDVTVAADNTYEYEVSALDAAGHESARSNAATVTTPNTLTFDAQADARVQQANSSTNYGTSTTLRTDGGADPDVESFLRFQVSGASGVVKSAKLRLFATTGTANGPAAYKTSWTGSETSLTWSNRTARTSGATDDKGAISAGGVVEFDVSPLVTGNGTHSFILATTSTDEVDFSSRETSTTSRRPQLVVSFGQDTQDPTPPSSLSAQGVSSSQVDLSWSAASDDSAVTGYKVYRDDALLTTIGAQTSWSDTTASAGATYAYEVSALDSAGHESGRSNTATVTIPFVFAAEADARVQQANPSTNYGTATQLRVVAGSNPPVETFVRFQPAGVTFPIQGAKLRLYVTNGTADGPAVYGTGWTGSETALTWNNRTTRTTAAADDRGAIAVSSFVDFDVTPLVTANGATSFILATTSTDGVDFGSRETSTVERRPQLLITP